MLYSDCLDQSQKKTVILGMYYNISTTIDLSEVSSGNMIDKQHARQSLAMDPIQNSIGDFMRVESSSLSFQIAKDQFLGYHLFTALPMEK